MESERSQPNGKQGVPQEAAIHRLVQCWQTEGVKLNPPAPNLQITKLEAVLGTAELNEIATFYSLANGMVDYEWDRYLVSFWSIERILREHTSGTKEICFADFLISSWSFVYRRTQSGIVIGYDQIPGSITLPNFGAFADIYLNNPEQLGLFCMKAVSQTWRAT